MQGGHAKKWRAGGGVPPRGKAIRRPPRRGGAERAGPTARSVNLKALICLRHLQISKSEFLDPPIIPPGGQRIPPGRPKNAVAPILKSIKILIIFQHRCLIDLGSFWGAILGSFWGFLEVKRGQVRSKTRLEGLSTPKTLIFTKYYKPER